MKTIVDVVNFNADASCLSSNHWLKLLTGGESSVFYQWLNLYIKYQKKIVLGFPGATVADIVSFNPQSIDIINQHPELFEIIIRPFSHDNALLRQENTFRINLHYGQKTIRKEFRNITNYFLPPEFMCTNAQIKQLKDNEIQGVFINSSRFSEEISNRIPKNPYELKGIFGSKMNCIPFDSELTNYYLDSIHYYNCDKWNAGICQSNKEILFSWRDGESCFIIPDSIKREECWLKQESEKYQRGLLKELVLNFTGIKELEKINYNSYPVHSLTPWMKEMRMLGYINRLQNIEGNFNELNQQQIHLWLQAINSDILSAVEKDSPVIKIKNDPDSKTFDNYTILRKDKGFEGEEFIALIENFDKEIFDKYIGTSNEPHIIKLHARLEYLKELNY